MDLLFLTGLAFVGIGAAMLGFSSARRRRQLREPEYLEMTDERRRMLVDAERGEHA